MICCFCSIGGDIRSKTATAARPVFRLYEAGNATAGRLLEQAAEEIALAISAALKAEAGGEPLPVILSGSLLRPEEALFSLVEKKARALGCPVSDFLFPQVHPAAAAAALAVRRGLRWCSGNSLTERKGGAAMKAGFARRNYHPGRLHAHGGLRQADLPSTGCLDPWASPLWR